MGAKPTHAPIRCRYAKIRNSVVLAKITLFLGLRSSITCCLFSLRPRVRQLARTATICFGFLTSVAWSLQNRGSKYWQEAWEQKVEKAQTAVLGQDLFKHKEDLLPKSEDRNWRHHWLRARRYSVSKLAIAMSDLAVFLWLFLASLDSNADLKASVDYPKTSLYVGSLLFAAAISYFGLSNEKLKPPHLT